MKVGARFLAFLRPPLDFLVDFSFFFFNGRYIATDGAVYFWRKLFLKDQFSPFRLCGWTNTINEWNDPSVCRSSRGLGFFFSFSFTPPLLADDLIRSASDIICVSLRAFREADIRSVPTATRLSTISQSNIISPHPPFRHHLSIFHHTHTHMDFTYWSDHSRLYSNHVSIGLFFFTDLYLPIFQSVSCIYRSHCCCCCCPFRTMEISAWLMDIIFPLAALFICWQRALDPEINMWKAAAALVLVIFHEASTGALSSQSCHSWCFLE